MSRRPALAAIQTDKIGSALKAELIKRLKVVMADIEQQPDGGTWSPAVLKRLELVLSLVKGMTG